MKKLWLLLLLSGVAGAACTDYPVAHDIQKLEYRLEKIGASLKVMLTFPKLSTHPSCTVTPVQWGTMWEFGLDRTEPVQVQVTDFNGAVVQEYALYGPMELKVTATRTTLRLYSSLTSKKIADHRLRSVELANDAPLFALPAVEVEDAGVVRTLTGVKTIR